ncbi:MAG: 2-aminoadipate transaminase [Solirubrobacterales bacterium]|nr:2-aminoadipate transaminase [Solirubrobacterales bacterium]
MPDDVISFARGAPSADILPHELVREAAAKALETDWQRALSYGTGRGHPGLAEWIAGLHDIDPQRVMVTNGSMEAASLLFQHYLEPGDRVIVEQPTYDRTLLLLRRRGVELVPVPLDADGVDVGAVERALDEGPVKLAHLITNFHNPAGCTLSSAKRKRLAALAAERGFTIFEDDPYRLVRFEGEELPTLLSLDSADRVIHASSFSKTVSPGVRIGYLAGPAAEIATLAKRANESYISPNMLAESIVYELCTSGGLDRNIEIVCAALRERRDALVDALHEHFPEGRFVVPGGGYFLWVELPEDVDTVALLEASKAEGVTFVAGPDFLVEGGRSSLRFSFASEPAERIGEGVARIARALEGTRAPSPA